ncbi:hypothetical protein OAG20_02610 [Verrucomicrobiales bacterium]|nr:hypothetical protein [Verrucomicrobiales bacterium]
MDSIASSSGATRPSLIPEKWAVQQLKTHGSVPICGGPNDQGNTD